MLFLSGDLTSVGLAMPALTASPCVIRGQWGESLGTLFLHKHRRRFGNTYQHGWFSAFFDDARFCISISIHTRLCSLSRSVSLGRGRVYIGGTPTRQSTIPSQCHHRERRKRSPSRVDPIKSGLSANSAPGGIDAEKLTTKVSSGPNRTKIWSLLRVGRSRQHARPDRLNR